MSNIAEIEAAIEKLPIAEVNELANWLEIFQQRRLRPAPAESWLERARGAARPGAQTEALLTLTRGDE